MAHHLKTLHSSSLGRLWTRSSWGKGTATNAGTSPVRKLEPVFCRQIGAFRRVDSRDRGSPACPSDHGDPRGRYLVPMRLTNMPLWLYFRSVSSSEKSVKL